MQATMVLRRRMRWAVRHALARRAVHRGMRASELGSRLMIEPTTREDPFPCYNQLRDGGRIVRSGMTASVGRKSINLPFWTLLLITPVALLTANLLAAIPGRRAAQLRTAEILRVE